MQLTTHGILESSLYVTDVARSAQFYEKIFRFAVISDFGERGCAMKAGDRQVLLLFKKGGSRDMLSPHDGDGELHLAFAIASSQLASWEAWLEENGIAVEEKHAGSQVATASIFGIQTGTYSSSLHLVSGRFIEYGPIPPPSIATKHESQFHGLEQARITRSAINA